MTIPAVDDTSAAPVAARRVALGEGDGVQPPLPTIVVLSALFPSSVQPLAGLFIRERMFRLRPQARLVVVSPQPWFPLQGLIRRFVPGYRPPHPRQERQDGVQVHFPRFLSFPGMLRRLDGISMAVCTYPLLRRLRREIGVGLIDAHFAYPAGYAGVRLGRWLGVPVAITLRGTESVHLASPPLARRVVEAVRNAHRVFSVSDALRDLLAGRGVRRDHIEVIGNGVDTSLFHPVDRAAARARFGVPADARVIVSVGGLVERKGFHRVLDVMPRLAHDVPALHYVIVGGASPAGDMGAQLREQVERLGLASRVTFTGPLPPADVKWALSAADVFVLATRYEGWANVFLEAMACGLPVVTTRVGGNAEVVCSSDLGTLVPFGDGEALRLAIAQALEREWDRPVIIAHARDNGWDTRVAILAERFREMTATPAAAGRSGQRHA